MNQFLIFFSATNDALLTIGAFESRAISAAAAIGSAVAVKAVDVDSPSAPLANWSQVATIECVTIVDGAVRDRRINPTLGTIDAMIRQMQVATDREFAVFFSGTNDAHLTVDAFVSRAMARAAALSKTVFVRSVDVDGGAPALWNGANTIECVIARGGEKISGRVNPSLTQIDQMVDQL